MDKTYIFNGEEGYQNGLLASIIPALQNRGVDTASLIAALGNNNGGLFGGRGFEDIIALIIVAAIFGNGNGFGFGNGNGHNSTEREMLMSAIQRNGVDLSALANTLHCSVGDLQNGINNVATQICNLSAQNGQSALQIINAVQAGDNAIVSKLCDCCCENRLATCQQTNTLTNAINSVAVGQERGFSNIAYESQKQTCDITKAIADNTAQVLAGQRAAEMREITRELAERDRKIAEQAVIINNAQQTSVFGQMINGAVAPILAGQRDFSERLAKIECHQPETITVAKNNGVYLDGCCATALGLNGGFFGYGFGGYPYGANGGFFG